jgi:hypothetical protein
MQVAQINSQYVSGAMKLIIKLTAVLLFISIIGCSEKDKQAKTSDPVVLKTQREALDKAKKIEGMLQDAAEQERKTIDESTHSEKQ